MNETEKQLLELDDEYASAEAPEAGQFEPLPNGKYQVKVEEVCLDESKSGNLMLKWTLQVISGKFLNRKLWKNNMLQSPNNLKFLKGDLGTCGIKLDKLSELPSRLGKLLDIPLEVTVKNRDVDGKIMSDVYFNMKLVNAEDISQDDIPF